MMNIFYRARTGVALALVASATACSQFRDQLLDPQQPGVIGPTSVQSATAADALRKGAISRLYGVTAGGESVWLLGGMLTDEWKSGDTFTQRNETDQRIIQKDNANISPTYTAEHRLRGAAYDALAALRTYIPDTTSKQAQMYWVMGYAEMSLSETFCNGIPFGTTVNGVPTYGDPLTNAQGFALALTHLDSALTLITAADTFSVSVKNAIQLTRARVLIDMGGAANVAAAVTAAGTVPTAYQYLQTFALTSGDNQIWALNNSAKRWVVGDSFDTGGIINNALPFASAGDPRVVVLGTTINSNQKKAFDTSTWFVLQNMWQRSDPIPLASGIDARLIEAEGQLQANTPAGDAAMLVILNQLRATNPKIGNFQPAAMAALPASTIATHAAAINIFFREKAFWDFGRGSRLSDLRRLMRQYGRPDPFPSGQWFKVAGITYGTDVNFPVTTNENPNPKWTGCLDRNP